MKLIYDKQNYNLPVNLEFVTGVFAPDTPSKDGNYYILFYMMSGKNHFWLYQSKEDRDFAYTNFILPFFDFIGNE